jgi:hypothetical protein
MPSILRSRLALIALMGAFLIPIGMSSLRGLTHVLTCEERSATPFTVVVPPEGPPEVLSSTRITRAEPGESAGPEDICGGLSLDIGARSSGGDEVVLILPITNNTEELWRGSVTLDLGTTSVPVDIGEIPAGETATDRVSFEPEEGQVEIAGSLLIGP